MVNRASPPIRHAIYQELSPSIHWAQQHNRTPQFYWTRRIADFELLYVIRGEIRALIEDQEWIVPSGTLLFLPSGVHHHVEVISEPNVQLLGIHFDFFSELEVRSDEDIIIDEKNMVEARICTLPYFEDSPIFAAPMTLTPPAQVVSLMEFIIHEWNERKLGYEIICKGLMLQIISFLMRGDEESKRIVHPTYEEGIQTLANELTVNYRKKWTSVDMATHLNVHEEYMSKLFKARIGMTPNKYLQSIRHRQAKKLLRETDDKIEAIAYQIGYSDLHYFSRVFKKWEGMSAKEYRKFSRIF